MEFKKILIICLVIFTMVFATFAPVSKIVFAATTDTLTLSFDPIGNASMDIGPNSYNFSTIWGGSYQHTTSNYFTVWNNGTLDDVVVDARLITISNANMDVAIGATGTQTDNTFSIRVRRGTVTNSSYITNQFWNQIDSALDNGSPHNLGIRLTLSNITSNWSWETLTITIRGTPP